MDGLNVDNSGLQKHLTVGCPAGVMPLAVQYSQSLPWYQGAVQHSAFVTAIYISVLRGFAGTFTKAALVVSETGSCHKFGLKDHLPSLIQPVAPVTISSMLETFPECQLSDVCATKILPFPSLG